MEPKKLGRDYFSTISTRPEVSSAIWKNGTLHFAARESFLGNVHRPREAWDFIGAKLRFQNSN